MEASKTYTLSLEDNCVLWFGALSGREGYLKNTFFWEADSFRPDIKKVFKGNHSGMKANVSFKQEYITGIGDISVPYMVEYDKRIFVNVR